MCVFCEKYGDGVKWYLNPKNYARNMYKIRKPEQMQSGADADPQAAGMGGSEITDLIKARLLGDSKWEGQIKEKALKEAYNTHFCQVVTLDEFLQILDIAYPIAKMTCACRRVTRGTLDEDNFNCMGVGPGMYKWERWPETYRGGLEFLTPEEAKEWAMAQDQTGKVHTIEPFGTPYIGGLCQCEYPVCGAIRNRVDYDFKFLIKGEYVAKVDMDKCTGCKLCISRCHFKALHFEPNINKALVEMQTCYGCGLCKTACKKDAIELIDRNSLPALKDNW